MHMKGEGGNNTENFADVLYTCHLGVQRFNAVADLPPSFKIFVLVFVEPNQYPHLYQAATAV